MVILGTMFFAILPISELRGAIPFGIFNHLGYPLTLLISISFNFLASFIALFFLDIFHKIFYRLNFYKNFFDNFLSKRVNKAKDKIDRYGYIGLSLFVGIPLPVTGVWTACLAIYTLKMKRMKALFYIFLGLLISAFIVTLVIYTGSNLAYILTKKL